MGPSFKFSCIIFEPSSICNTLDSVDVDARWTSGVWHGVRGIVDPYKSPQFRDDIKSYITT